MSARAAVRRAALGAPGDPRWARPGLWAVLALAAVLYTWALGRNGYANDYYAAAILSGTQSWKAFFFGALDAGSFITVDKPPLALWVMGLSARIFGFGTWSMLLPQALAGVAAVGILHSAVRRALPGTAGHAAALLAALVMTLTPITVAINRDNNPDTLLVLLLVAAAWLCQESVRTGRTRTLVLSAVAVGLAFNVKMLQAYLVVPVFAAVHLFLAPGTVARRLGRLLAAGAALVASSAWWMAIVDLWPAGSRPYVGGSSDDSVWDLVVGYNGLGRIFGPGGGARGRGAAGNPPPGVPADLPEGLTRAPGGGPGGFGGTSGAGRLFNDILAGQISWLLPFAVLALVAGLVLAFRGSLRGARTALLLWGGWLAVHYVVFSFAEGIFHPYYTTAMAPAVAAPTGVGGVLMWRAARRSRAWAAVLAGGLAVTGTWSFAVLRRSPDFVPWLAWAVAAMAAVAAVTLLMVRLGGRARRAAAVTVLVTGLFAGLAGPAAYALTPLGSPVMGTNPTAGPAGSGMPGMLIRRPGTPGARDGGSGGGSGAGSGDRLPGGAGERLPGDASGPRLIRLGPAGLDDDLLGYLERNRGGATWLVAVDSAQSAASAILSTGRPVIAMGGFGGSDPAMSVDRLRELVSTGRLRYVLPGGGPGGFGGPGGSGGSGGSAGSGASGEPGRSTGTAGGSGAPDAAGPSGGSGGPGGGRGNSEALAWVRANCAVVPAAEYGGTGGGGTGDGGAGDEGAGDEGAGGGGTGEDRTLYRCG
ncbi:glycosyltransferase family 39 protein [Streptosporangium sp. NPDC048047]|uniref:glycosyltransferase family 39 protein n=1 Tax=Streptosporangium sp. NPDC048047 TaxID=3155748 RepID=UPI003413D48A